MPSPKAHHLLILGTDRVGKTAIIEQLIFGNHVIGQGGPPTRGDIYEASFETEKGTCEKLQIFDTPGSLFANSKNNYEQEHFLSIADGVVLVYEITSRASFDLVTSLRQRVSVKNRDLPMVVIGNKRDLNGIRAVPVNKSQQWARSHGLRPYEVTVLDRDSLKDPFCYIAWRMANPGKPFSVIPLLTTTTGTLTNAALSKVNTHTTDRPPLQQSASVKGSGESRLSTATLSSTDESDSTLEGAVGRTISQDYPDDAEYPSGKGPLFLVDCLSSKNKAHMNGRH